MSNPALVIAAILTLTPFLSAAFFPGSLARLADRIPLPARLFCPATLSIPYLLVALASGIFRWQWFALYIALPVLVSMLLWQAGRADPVQRGNWRDFLVLTVIALAVDLRWFEHAWPARLIVFNKLLLLDAAIYGFLALRRLDGVGFDLRLRPRDIAIGLREFLLCAPIAIPIGIALGFLHLHSAMPSLPRFAGTLLFTFFLIAVPEELFFRGWLQNLLERRCGRYPALFITAALFGLSHWNKRAVHFNWRYVLLASLAGIFYGRAWRSERRVAISERRGAVSDRRVAASAITHASVDTVWAIWLR
jgi:hypothetical protein